MRKITVLILGAMLLVALPAVVFAAHGSVTRVADLHEENGSGITGTIKFTQLGSGGVKVTGKATGLDPSAGYHSLVYGVGTNPGPGGDRICLPPPGLPNMLIGSWKVHKNGSGTLVGTNPNDIGTFDTVSIRVGATGPGPLLACGLVAEKPAHSD